MPIDPYSPCPGGSGKKIKFCCPDLIGELQTIDQMLQGEQFQAALDHITQLEIKFPGRACLKATKSLLMRVLNRIEEAKPYVEDFVHFHPDNSIAWSEMALVKAATEGGRAAMEPLQNALAYSTREVLDRVYDMIGMVAGVLALEGEFLAARSLFATQTVLARHDPQPFEMLMELNASSAIPLWVKDERRPVVAPADAPWKQDYDDAIEPAQHAQWTEAERNLTALVEQYPDVPAICRSLATMRGWVANRPGLIEAARKFAAFDVPDEDAAEAEALAMFFSEDPLGDEVDELELEYAVTDVEQAKILLSSSAFAAPMQVNPAALVEEGEPPPIAAWSIFDRTLPGSAADLTLETVPRVICRVLLFGRQTDREARLEVVDVTRPDLDLVKERVTGAAGPHLGDLVREEVSDKTPRTVTLLARNWRVPAGVTRDHLKHLIREHERQTLLEQWVKLPLGVLDGKTPEEAASDGILRKRLLGAILMLEFWMERSGSRFDFNELRTRLGLPALGPIDPAQVTVEDLPVSRIARLEAEKLSDEQLLITYRRAVGFRASAAVEKFARAVVERPSMAEQPERMSALSILARSEEDPEKALGYVEEGRKMAIAAGRSCSAWDFMELTVQIARANGEAANRVLQHLVKQHINEPGVAEAIQRILVEIGAIRPDGTPVPQAAQQATAAEPGIVVPGVAGTPQAEPGKLWTPDGTPPSAPSGEKPRIWTPGME